MNQEEILRLENLAVDLNTDLCILKNAIKNNDDNDLQITDLMDSLEKIYKISNKIREISSNFRI
jgi:hypothetical protein